MQGDKSYTLNKFTKIPHKLSNSSQADINSQRNFLFPQEIIELQQLFNREEKAKKNLFFWNGMAEGKLESISSCTNLFILLLILTLGSDKYNGTGQGGSYALGWICVGQVCFFYLSLVILKFCYIPYLERQLQQNNTEGFKLYSKVQNGKTKLQNLELSELELIQETIALNHVQFEKCFKTADSDVVLQQINSVIKSRSSVQYMVNVELKNLKFKEQKAKWWQNFWQSWMIGKTYTVPGILLLVFIITPLSNATVKMTSTAMHTAQGWLAIGFWAGCILLLIIIKVFLWDYLNQKVQNTRTDIFVAYNPISLKHKQLNSLSLTQLQDLQNVLVNRVSDFQACFTENPNSVLESVRVILKERLPNKRSDDEEEKIRQIVKKEKDLNQTYGSWLLFFNIRIISTIINSLKFLIVIAITFAPDYNTSDAISAQNAKIAVGSVGIGCFVFGYLFYLFVRFYYLGFLERKAKEGRSSSFTTYRLVYFGNKNLNDLQVHELQDISDGLNLRKSEFTRCFTSVNPQTIESDIKKIITQKLAPYQSLDPVYELHQDELESKKWLAFWMGYVDGPLLTSMYSIYVILVLMLVTFGEVYASISVVMGWIGVGNLVLLILIVLFFKTFLIEYLTNSVKSLKIEGYSEFDLVYTKAKQLKDVEISELQKIHKIIETHPIEFRRLFPRAGLQSTANEVKLMIAKKQYQRSNARVRTASQQIRYQIVQLELSRNKNALATWSSLVNDRLFVITPVAIVIYILWAQCIATTKYGVTVCGFLTVANLAVIFFLVLFFNLFYRGHLESKIADGEKEIRMLSTKPPVILNI